MEKMLRILVVDDDSSFGAILQQLLKLKMTKEHETLISLQQVMNCAQCEDILSRSAFDVILMDQGMAGKDGLECTRDIRNKFPDIPVIMLTGSCDERLKEEAFEAGVDDFVEKTKMTEFLGHVIWSAAFRRRGRRCVHQDVEARRDQLKFLKV